MNCPAITEPSGLLSLPQELLLKVTSHLDPASAVALSMTCRSLQPPAECRIWSQIRITERDIFENRSKTFKLDYSTLNFDDPHADEGKDLFDSLANTHSGAWALKSQAVLFHFNYLLTRHHWRKSCVKKLNLELRHEIPQELVDLLKGLPCLEDLELRFPEYPSSLLDAHCLPGFISCLQLFRSLENNPLERLRNIKVYLVYDWNETVLSILRSAPNLECLHIGGQILYTKQFKQFNPAIDSIEGPKSLKSLVIDEMHPFFVPTLNAIVDASPNLHKVALRDEFFRWRPKLDNSLLESLSKLDNLREMEVSSNCFDALCDLEGWTTVEDLKLSWSTVMLKERENYGMITIPCLIPPLLNLQRYQIQVSYYSTSSHGFEHLAEPSSSVLATLLSRLLMELADAPQLRIISYSDNPPLQGEGEETDDLRWEWKSDRFQGLLVYSYTNDDGDELFHCRSKFQHSSHKLNHRPRWMGNSAGWKEHGYYNGRAIPTRVLAGVYGATGVTVSGNEPGIGLHMSKEGWDLLRAGRGQDESWTGAFLESNRT
ncbi:hypothetical protein I302_107450 [Kwoniella bestiolae CBS 10118]|uniref:F-box domain-containing protein n=1 Tax=Kwoniella bestiolae CBS 10118 TaxID=1296100 RepID=A0A1B9FYI4_9TREE|nr:hypothetical protein I302_06809 [Kwoniella bestiolae CBS 10118]OCF23825.1 hypothetical protein I302_06809 [Kwoniella bestiolae CBS 10118]